MSQACSKCGEQESLASHAIHECTMKAFHLCHRRFPTEGALLVLSAKASTAKSLGIRKGPFDWDFTDISATRAKEWDGLFSAPCVVEDNDELPKGAKPFYSDSIDL